LELLASLGHLKERKKRGSDKVGGKFYFIKTKRNNFRVAFGGEPSPTYRAERRWMVDKKLLRLTK